MVGAGVELLGPSMNEDAHCRDVYAHLGLALWHAQGLEQGIIHALIFCDLLPKAHESDNEMNGDSFVAILDEYPKKTFGKLLKALKRTGEVLEQDFESKLAQSLEMRDWLVHHYLKNRCAHILSVAGRDQMISELIAADKLFTETDSQLETWLEPIRLRYGFTDEVLKTVYERYMAAVVC